MAARGRAGGVVSYGYVRLSAAASTARVIDVCPLYQFVLDCRALAPPRVLSDLRCQAPARPPAVRHPSPGTYSRVEKEPTPHNQGGLPRFAGLAVLGG